MKLLSQKNGVKFHLLVLVKVNKRMVKISF